MNKSLSIIFPVWNSKEILLAMIKVCEKLNPSEIIIVADEECNVIKELRNNKLCSFVIRDTNLQEDTGRLLGIKAAKGDVLLFLDGDIMLPQKTLAEFVEPIQSRNADVVLHKLEHYIKKNQILSPNMVWSQVINEVLDRNDLKIDSLQSYPHALTKEIVKVIGPNTFTNPILAHMKIIDHGWRISRVQGPDFIQLKQIHPYHEKNKTNYRNHFEALSEWFLYKGIRGGFTNGGKRIDILQQLKTRKSYPNYKKGLRGNSTIYNNKQLSIIIPAQNEELTIEMVIAEARKINPMEIIVVVNGSTDQTSSIASRLGATVIEYPERLGHNVGRAIGALEATGDILLFIDSDFSIEANKLYPFAKAISDGDDMTLNNLNEYLPIQYPLHNVSAFKYALNILCQKEELGIGSLIAVPHAISKPCLDIIGFETLVCPSLAQVKALQNGCKVSCIHAVDVMGPNRMRPEQHLGSYTDGGTRMYIEKKIKAHHNYPYFLKEFSRMPPIAKGWGAVSTLYNGKQLSVIIPAENHGKTIEKVIREARKIEPFEIIVVVSGSNDDTAEIGKKLGATVIEYKYRLDPDTSRAIGALLSTGDIINFVNPALKGQTQAELRIMGDHLEAISYISPPKQQRI